MCSLKHVYNNSNMEWSRQKKLFVPINVVIVCDQSPRIAGPLVKCSRDLWHGSKWCYYYPASRSTLCIWRRQWLSLLKAGCSLGQWNRNCNMHLCMFHMFHIIRGWTQNLAVPRTDLEYLPEWTSFSGYLNYKVRLDGSYLALVLYTFIMWMSSPFKS